MESKDSHLISIHEKFSQEINRLTGMMWKEVHSEIQSDFREIPVWILLYEDSSLEKAHRECVTMATPYFDLIGEFNFTVSYEVYRDRQLISLDQLTSNEEILRGWSVAPPLGSEPSPVDARYCVFQSQDSKRS